MKAVLSSVWAEAAMVISLFSDVLLMIALISIGWCKPVDPDIDPTFEGIGLWRHCIRQKDCYKHYPHCCKDLRQYNLPGWYTAVQILMTISFVGLIFTFISIYMYACIDRFSKERKLLLIYGILTLVFASVGVAGVVIFSQRIVDFKFKGYNLRAAWNFTNATVAFSFHYVCVILITIAVIRGSRPNVTSSGVRHVSGRTSDMTSTTPPVEVENATNESGSIA